MLKSWVQFTSKPAPLSLLHLRYTEQLHPSSCSGCNHTVTLGSIFRVYLASSTYSGASFPLSCHMDACPSLFPSMPASSPQPEEPFKSHILPFFSSKSSQTFLSQELSVKTMSLLSP